MEDIEKRLRESSDTCFASFSLWHKNKKDGPARESLQEAIHELRKVASRLEIELAISERDEMAQKRIPIPPHRDAKRRFPQSGDGEEFEPGNQMEPDSFSGNMPSLGPRPGGGDHRRRLQHKRPSQGGSHGGGSDHQS